MNPFIGQILMVAFNFAPQGWALCNGQLLPISQNQALFSLLGTYYGGDGRTNFALPNLQGRVPIHQGSNGVGNYVMGMIGGVENVTLLVNNMPSHSHAANCSTTLGPNADPAKNFWAEVNTGGKHPTASPAYAASANAQMAPTAIGATGGNQPVSVVQPFLCVNFIIALQGIFPARN
ncbi:MAG TPA: tail fiber protein [Edaphobacter sp.]